MKDSIRDKNIKKRKALRPRIIKETGERMMLSFLNSELLSFESFMSYYPVNNEAPVIPIIESLLSKGKKVFMPGTCDDDSLEVLAFSGFTDMTVGKYNIPEPAGHVVCNPDDIDVVLVPGVAFDRRGGRIGYGKGCYDKFLEGRNVVKVGICYGFQIMKSGLPGESHDIEMDFLLTEKGLIEV